MTDLQPGDAVQITLVAKPTTLPPGVRLRQLLKAALRIWGFTCTEVQEIPSSANTEKNPRTPNARVKEV